MDRTFRGPSRHSPERPDAFFGLVAGLYVAALVSPALLTPVALWVSGDAAVLYLGLLAIVTTVTGVAGWGVTRWRGAAERLGRTPLAWLLPLFGLLATGGYFVVGTAVLDGSASGVGVTGFFAGTFAMLLGYALLAMSRTRYARAVVDEAAVELEFSGGWPDRRRRWLLGAVLALFAVSGVGLVLEFAGVVDPGFSPWGILPGIAAAAFSLGTERTYRVTPMGLERRLPALRQFYPWDAFEGVAVTGDAVVLRRRRPWQVDFRCARADLDDADAVVDALAAHVARVD